MSQLVYRRIVLKLSGEALMGDADYGIDPAMIGRLAAEVIEAQQAGAEIALVIGGGNIFRGAGLAGAGMRHLEKGRIAIFAAGTGNPFFTTDSGAALRAIEIGADLLLKATKVDGVYDSDPKKNPDAKRFDSLTYDQVISRDLNVMDTAAFALCRDSDLPLRIFDMGQAGVLLRILRGEHIGTLVKGRD